MVVEVIPVNPRPDLRKVQQKKNTAAEPARYADQYEGKHCSDKGADEDDSEDDDEDEDDASKGMSPLCMVSIILGGLASIVGIVWAVVHFACSDSGGNGKVGTDKAVDIVATTGDATTGNAKGGNGKAGNVKVVDATTGDAKGGTEQGSNDKAVAAKGIPPTAESFWEETVKACKKADIDLKEDDVNAPSDEGLPKGINYGGIRREKANIKGDLKKCADGDTVVWSTFTAVQGKYGAEAVKGEKGCAMQCIGASKKFMTFGGEKSDVGLLHQTDDFRKPGGVVIEGW